MSGRTRDGDRRGAGRRQRGRTFRATIRRRGTFRLQPRGKLRTGSTLADPHTTGGARQMEEKPHSEGLDRGGRLPRADLTAGLHRPSVAASCWPIQARRALHCPSEGLTAPASNP
jgi:hypothetical protein